VRSSRLGWKRQYLTAQPLFSLLANGGVARERMIGWYHTGPKLRASDLEINELFKRFIARPVMVIVDVRPQTVGIPTDAYFAVEEIKDVRACQ
jgi:proteasome lid subunit RPN8/RPN11